ncbi:hypothetical protein DAPPUDRAFT_261271 [Daphnia pulex]|uniref:Uncharacterized protein n=1 Tax=Daphnia pulex TaxID=6669 RepID=E9HKT3_DAPPU|nr:hypothetical protein DAPPUDRAFT_261271 [Daphnia pulex]|eukprot:EFX67660.1 hypothetical protein DAPPUDRAFT_261271 [Daphnia pulex]
MDYFFTVHHAIIPFILTTLFDIYVLPNVSEFSLSSADGQTSSRLKTVDITEVIFQP